MDYVVGSVAALISGNVTPNRPKLIKRALTPTKHQPSPNVTPKSEMVEDRSIFLSPTLQKKKAIVKKSPKRIFENPDLDSTEDGDRTSLTSPKVATVKKHLKDKLDDNADNSKSIKGHKSPKVEANLSDSKVDEKNADKGLEANLSEVNESTPQKKKKKNSSSQNVAAHSESELLPGLNCSSELVNTPVNNKNSPKKLKERRKSTIDETENMHTDQGTTVNQTVALEEENTNIKSKAKKRKIESENTSNGSAKELKLNSSDKLSKSQKKRLQRKLRLQRRKAIKNQVNAERNDEQSPTKEEDQTKASNKSTINELKDTNNENINPNENQKDTESKSFKKKNKTQNEQIDNIKNQKETQNTFTKKKNKATNKKIANVENQEETQNTLTKKKNKSINKQIDNTENPEETQNTLLKKKNKSKNKQIDNTENNKTNYEHTDELKQSNEESEPVEDSNKNSKKSRKSKQSTQQEVRGEEIESPKKKKVKSKSDNEENIQETEPKLQNKKNKTFVNPNAITDKDSDSEHESDDEIESETEEINKKALETPVSDQSSDEEVDEPVKEKKIEKVEHKIDDNEIKRTLFVGNVPFSAKCKKQIKKIFNKYGQIETVRIRTVPVKDARDTPKLAVIKKELHPERTTVNMYIKYQDPESVEKALVENNTVLEENHLRVSRSDRTGAEHDPRLAVFVGNLPFSIEDDALRSKFEKCGEIESVRIIRDKKTNAGKGFGYVNFASKDGVELALALSEEDLTIKNRILRVKRCTQMTHKQSHIKKNHNWGAKQEPVGAFRRLMTKRQHQDGNVDGPPNKRPKNLNQPQKEKKPRKEFVGMTAEKKKKRKFDKGQKKKKVLSQILKNKS